MIKEGWVVCPYCGKKQFPLNEKAKIEDLEYRCKQCKKYFEVNTQSRA